MVYRVVVCIIERDFVGETDFFLERRVHLLTVSGVVPICTE
jgi:hypothetical protein